MKYLNISYINLLLYFFVSIKIKMIPYVIRMVVSILQPQSKALLRIKGASTTLFHVHPHKPTNTVFFVIIFKSWQKNIVNRPAFVSFMCVCAVIRKIGARLKKKRFLIVFVNEGIPSAPCIHTSPFVKRDRPDDIFILFNFLFFFAEVAYFHV